MADDPILAAWERSASELVMLPGGMEVRVELPLVMEMVRSGALPSGLRALALKFASDVGVEPDELGGEDAAHWDELVGLLVARSVKAVRPVKAEGPPDEQCSCGGWHTDEPPVPYRLDPEILTAEPPRLPRVDVVALQDMVLRVRTPKQVDAISRVAHGQMDPGTAADIVRAERGATLEGWSSFRALRAGTAAGAQRQDLGDAAIGAARPNRAARRAADRRRSGTTPRATATRGRRAASR